MTIHNVDTRDYDFESIQDPEAWANDFLGEVPESYAYMDREDVFAENDPTVPTRLIDALTLNNDFEDIVLEAA